MASEAPEKKPWGGRFTAPTNAFVEAFTASIDFDRRLYRHDIEGSVAHARMLARVGVLAAEEAEAIVQGLRGVREDIEAGRLAWSAALEDIHMHVESALTAHIGPIGKKLHTARSRNDQSATDLRLFLREEVDAIVEDLRRLQGGIVDLAEREAQTVMPGFTHLQTAQPVTFGHHLMAWYEMLTRDEERLAECRRRINRSPLGAAALAGTTFPIDRGYTAGLLGFESVCANSLDAVSDRDFLVELAADCALLMMHLSRFAEELVLWSSSQFGFIDLGDAFCTGSSIMPQKKNPDVPELVRGKAGRVFGHLMGLLTLMKAQPLAYNRDNQEDKEAIFDTVDTVRACLRVFADLVPAIAVDGEAMRAAARRGFATATDLADYLVRRGMPFRDAHEAVGRAVRHALETGRDLAELGLEELRRFAPMIGPEVFEVLTLEGSVAARDHLGGTAPRQVRAAVTRARARLARAGAGTR